MNRSGKLTLVLVAIPLLTGFAPPSARPAQWNFQDDVVGQNARGFSNDRGRWQIELDGDNKVLAQRAENRINVINVAMLDDTSYRDVDLSLRLKADRGENEQGGGLVFRAQDKDNYYVARMNPYRSKVNTTKPSFCLFKVENGIVTQMDRAESPTDKEWHTLRVTAKGPEIVAYLDGQKLLEAEDSTFLNVGHIGLWTKSDACTLFDDLTVSGLTGDAGGRE
jgi:hypothetical protein